MAGVLLGLLVPVSRELEEDPDRHSLAERLEHKIRPFSAGFAVPVFAFFAAGVTVVGGGLSGAFTDPVAIGVVVALVLGKAVGIFGSTWTMARFTRAELDDDLTWTDVFGLALLAGVGFTVSLLVGELAFGTGSERDDHVKAPSSSAASSPPSWPPSCCAGATGTTARSRSERTPMPTGTGYPTCTSGAERPRARSHAPAPTRPLSRAAPVGLWVRAAQ